MPDMMPVSPDWGNTITSTANIAKEPLAEGGVIARGLKGINPINRLWTVTINTDKYEELETFLKAQKGKEFTIPYLDDNTVSDGYLYRYKIYSVIYLSPTTRGFNIELKQTRRYNID